MATAIRLKHPQTGAIATGYYGFSWTTFFFNGFPALLRRDYATGLAVIVLAIVSFLILPMLWAFVYNRVYTLRLIDRGYEIQGTEEEIARARRKLRLDDVPDS
jgi:hypothetical protein